MPGEFNVQVLLSLRNRISSGLLAIGRDFRGTEQRVRSLRLALADLQAREALGTRRAALAAQADKDAISLLGQKQAKILALDASEQTLAQRRALNAQIRAREERAAIRNMAQQINLTRQLNREAEIRGAIQREGLLTRGAFQLGGGLATGFALGHLVRAGMPVGVAQFQAQLAGNLSGAQAAALAKRALGVSNQLGVIGWTQEMQIATQLLAQMPRGVAMRTLLPISQAADVIAQLQGKGGSISGSAEMLGALSNLLGARTALQAQTVGNTAFNILRRTGASVDVGRLGRFATFVAGVTPGATVAQRAQSFEQLAILSARLGQMEGGFSGREIRLLEQSLLFPHTGRQIALGNYLERFGLARTTSGRTVANQVNAIRRAMGSPGGAFQLRFLAGSNELVGMMQTLARANSDLVGSITRSTHQNITIQTGWAQSMRLSSNQLKRLETNFHNLEMVIGHQLDPVFSPMLHGFGTLAGQAAILANKAPAVTRALGLFAGSWATLATARGSLRILSTVADKFGAGALANNMARFAGALDLMSRALGPLSLMLTEAQGLRKAWQLRNAKGITGELARSFLVGGEPRLAFDYLKKGIGALGAHPNYPIGVPGGAIQISGPVNIHPGAIVVSGAGNPDAVANKVMERISRGLGQAAKSNTKARGPVASPHVYPGAK